MKETEPVYRKSSILVDLVLRDPSQGIWWDLATRTSTKKMKSALYSDSVVVINMHKSIIINYYTTQFVLFFFQIKDFDLMLLKGKTFFKGYKTDVNPSIFSGFAVAAYRFGHSLIQDEFRRFSQEGFQCQSCNHEKDEFFSIPMKDFGNPFYLYDKCEGGIDSIFRGLVKNAAAKADG